MKAKRCGQIPAFLLAVLFLLVSCAPTQPTVDTSSSTIVGPSDQTPDNTSESTSADTEETAGTTKPESTKPESTTVPEETEGSAQTSETTQLVFLDPVENQAPEIGYTPAFDGQTRAPGLATQTPYQVEIVSDGLDEPWGIAALPDGRFAITEKNGSLRLMTADGLLSEPIRGFPDLDTRSQGGLLDVAAAPDFENSRLLYFTFAELTEAGSATAMGRGCLSEDETVIEDFESLFTATPYYDNGMHFGSRLVFDDAGNLFVSTGERSDLATRYNARDVASGHGKILYLTADGLPVAGAPWVTAEGAWPEIYSYGHRNVQGLAIHPVTGELWASEMGPRGGDELNLIRPGLDYGWPLVSYGIEYGGSPIGDGITQAEGTEQPVYYWDPVIAPSGMTFYTSGEISEWTNNLFIAGLRGSHIARLVLEGNRVIGEERLLGEAGERFRDIEELNGALFAITDSGRVYRLGP